MLEKANSFSIVTNYAKNVQRWLEKERCKKTPTSNCFKEVHLRMSEAKYKIQFVRQFLACRSSSVRT